MGLHRWLALLLTLTAAAGAQVISRQRTPEGREVFRLRLMLAAPADSDLLIEHGAVLTWNRHGRVVRSQRFTAEEFGSWTGRRVRLSAGQTLLFNRAETFWASEAAERCDYIFYGADGKGQRLRRVHRFDLNALSADSVTVTSQPLPTEPTFAVMCEPDGLDAVQSPRSGTMCWGFNIWLQETGGVPVTVQTVEWQARRPDGTSLGQEQFSAETLQQLLGRLPRCGPDGTLVLGRQQFRDPAGGSAGELMIAVTAKTDAGAEVSALGRFPLAAPVPRPARTPLILPFRGAWRVHAGPGDPPHIGNSRHGWLFEALNRRGQPYEGDGRRLRDHASYNQVVVAPAAGVAAVTLDLYPDATTFLGSGLFGGGNGENRIIIDHRNGEFSYLGGLLHDSITVRPGVLVQQGQELARVGNARAGQVRPMLVYRLIRQSTDEPSAESLEARFNNYDHLGPGEPRLVSVGAPETGDVVKPR